MLWIPNAAAMMPAPPESATLRTSVPGRMPLHARILLVEDSEDNQLLFCHVLTKAGATVDCANDGAQGITMALEASQQDRPYDLILMDVQMPELDGKEAARRLRVSGITSPIVALSAAAMEHNRREALEAGCNDFISKPIDLGQLVATVRSWTSRHVRK